MIEWTLLAENLSNRFDLELSVSSTTDKQGLLRVENIEAPNGFGIEVNIGWRSVDAIFKPDTFAAALLRTIGESSFSQRADFSGLSKAFIQHGVQVQLKIDGSVVDPVSIPKSKLDRFALQCTILCDHSNDDKAALEAASSCLALVLALLPLEKTDSEGVITSFAEGNPSRVEVTKYERNPSNRAAAITLHGTRCKACGFDFGEKYGELGIGFIEVHHKIPVSQMGENYMVNPVEDLVPLCPNCHRMVHRTNPPLDITELTERLKS